VLPLALEAVVAPPWPVLPLELDPLELVDAVCPLAPPDAAPLPPAAHAPAPTRSAVAKRGNHEVP
jgi:hypothetical protein